MKTMKPSAQKAYIPVMFIKLLRNITGIDGKDY